MPSRVVVSLRELPNTDSNVSFVELSVTDAFASISETDGSTPTPPPPFVGSADVWPGTLIQGM